MGKTGGTQSRANCSIAGRQNQSVIPEEKQNRIKLATSRFSKESRVDTVALEPASFPLPNTPSFCILLT
jgi:hypothetical protein